MNGRAYYNEIDRGAAAWLRELIARNLIARGDVDERDIREVTATDLANYTQCHFFAGVGGWSYALRLAGWPDERPVWTGSCPCQPFSAAGKRQGFTDDRHLWPTWVGLISQRRPSVLFGEQVASATEWLRLVRGDLEALGYAVGAIPIQAACAGADHLRDRFFFVGDSASYGRRKDDRSVDSASRGGQGGGLATGTSAGDWANTDDARPQGWQLHGECSGERTAWSDGLANPEGSDGRLSILERRPFQEGAEPQRRGEVHMADRDRQREPRGSPEEGGASGSGESQVGQPDGERDGLLNSRAHEWVVGADGKARRVKPGIRLLVDGFPSRVGLLRGFGNAIDPRPAKQFIGAYLDHERELAA